MSWETSRASGSATLLTQPTVGDDPDLIADAHTAQAIHVGDWVRSHNLATSLNEEAVTGNPASWAKYCPDCAARVHRRQKTESERKRRPCVDS